MTLYRTFGVAALALGASIALAAPALSDQININPRVIPVGKWAEGMAFDGTTLWVAESGQRSVAQINVGQGTVMRRITVGRLPVNMGFGSDGAVYALVQTDKSIWQYFPGAPQGKQIGGLEGCPQAMTVAPQNLVVVTWLNCSSESARVIVVDPRTNQRRSSQVLAEMAQSVVTHEGRIFVGHTRGPALSVLDAQSLSIQKVNLPDVSASTLTANAARLYIGGSLGQSDTQGLVVAVDPNTLREVRRQVLDQPIAFMTDDDRNVVAVGGNGRVYVFSAGNLELQRTINMPGIVFKADGGPRAIMIQGNDLYITSSQQFGENGAVLVLSGWRPAAMPAPAPPQPMPPAPAPAPSPAPIAGATDCPYQVVAGPDSTGIWMYEDPDAGATKVEAVPADSKGLVADRCLTTWCHVSFRGKAGWVQRSHIKAVCN